MRLGRFARRCQKQRRGAAEAAAAATAAADVKEESSSSCMESLLRDVVKDVAALNVKIDDSFEIIRDISRREDLLRIDLVTAVHQLDQLREDFEQHLDAPAPASQGSFSLEDQLQGLRRSLDVVQSRLEHLWSRQGIPGDAVRFQL